MFLKPTRNDFWLKYSFCKYFSECPTKGLNLFNYNVGIHLCSLVLLHHGYCRIHFILIVCQHILHPKQVADGQTNVGLLFHNKVNRRLLNKTPKSKNSRRQIILFSRKAAVPQLPCNSLHLLNG